MELLTREELHRLSAAERLDLISQLWDSLSPEDVPLTASQRNELDARLTTIDHDVDNGISWQDLRAELEQRLR